MNHNSVYSSMVRSGRTTYFIDVKEGKNGKRYVSIPETCLYQLRGICMPQRVPVKLTRQFCLDEVLL